MAFVLNSRRCAVGRHDHDPPQTSGKADPYAGQHRSPEPPVLRTPAEQAAWIREIRDGAK